MRKRGLGFGVSGFWLFPTLTGLLVSREGSTTMPNNRDNIVVLLLRTAPTGRVVVDAFVHNTLEAKDRRKLMRVVWYGLQAGFQVVLLPTNGG